MRLFIKTKNIFLTISIIILLMAFLVIFKFKKEAFGFFLLGIFVSTLIIALQAKMSAKIEESKLLTESLKQMSRMCFSFDEFNTFSVDFFANNFEETFFKYKEETEKMFMLNNKLGNILDLNRKTKKELRLINEKLFQLQLNLHFIFKEFHNQSNKMKIIYFMEFYKIIKSFNFKELEEMISNLGWKVDSREFYKSGYEEDINKKIKELEYDTSIQVYNKKVEQNNSIEYKALRTEFERFMKK